MATQRQPSQQPAVNFLFALFCFLTLAALSIVLFALFPALGMVGAATASRRQRFESNDHEQYNNIMPGINQDVFKQLLKQTVNLSNNMIGLTEHHLLHGGNPRATAMPTQSSPKKATPKTVTSAGGSQRYKKAEHPHFFDTLMAKKPALDAFKQCTQLAQSTQGIASIFSNQQTIKLCHEIWQPFMMTPAEQRQLATQLNQLLIDKPGLLVSDNVDKNYIDCAHITLNSLRDFIWQHVGSPSSSIALLDKAVADLAKTDLSKKPLTDLFKTNANKAEMKENEITQRPLENSQAAQNCL